MNIDYNLCTQNSFKNRLFKRLTLMLFFVLPTKFTNVFISLSLISLIFNVRNTSFADESSAVMRVGKMLHMRLDQNVLLLPEQTFRWYWTDDTLDKTIIKDHGVSYTVREIIKDNNLLMTHRQMVIDHLLGSLPKTLHTKLKLQNVENKLVIKHSVTTAFLYA